MHSKLQYNLLVNRRRTIMQLQSRDIETQVLLLRAAEMVGEYAGVS